MERIEQLIGDEQTPSPANYERLNPITGEVVSYAAAASVTDAERAADAAAAAFADWSTTGPNHRRAILLAAAEQLSAMAEQFVEAMISEIGATEGWARFNVALGASMLREAAAMTTQLTGETIPSDKPGCFAFSVRAPVGVVLGVAPWNAPVILGVRAIATALACGNTVVLKASEVCPRTHALIGSALRNAGAPAGVVNVITNAPADGPSIVSALIDHPSVKRINFTGSTKVGKLIAQRAAQHLKPVLLELGGKAPLLVLEDADIGEAVKAAAFGAFMNQGQICMSTERIIVDQTIADAFVAQLAAKAKTLTAGDPVQAQHPLGALCSVEAAASIKALIDDAVAKGANIVAGGAPTGVLMPATVIDHVTPEMAIYHEESFGPVVSVIRVAGEAAAVQVANDTDYGLTAAVFSRDVARALRVASRMETGMCHINGATVHDEAQMPFGGVKSSGYGRFGGRAGVAEFTNLRWITIETQAGRFPI